MKTVWYKGCKTKEEKDKRKLAIENGKTALEVLNLLLEDKIKSIQKERLADEVDEGFANRQIYLNSKEKVYKEVQELIKY